MDGSLARGRGTPQVPVLVRVTAQCPALERLELRFCRQTTDELVAQIVVNCRRITHLGVYSRLGRFLFCFFPPSFLD